jgi:hypothetical protein
MSFSAATCITFNPNVQTSTGPFNIYLNSDYDSTPINPLPIPLSNLQPPLCPYIIEVPDGTTDLGFRQEDDLYCITILIQDNDICDNCNLGLSQYPATSSAVITAGELTGTCEITDYRINWYGPNSTTTLAFSSGSGIYATPASTYTHPLSGPGRSIPSIAGVYTPVIDKVKINGITYSNTGGTGNILFSGSCLPTIEVLPLTCEVRTNTRTDYPYSAYSQVLKLDIASNTPQTVSSSFNISANTKYIAWIFDGFEIPDRITISLKGAAYGTTVIGLEDIEIGNQTGFPTNLTPNLYPKSGNTGNAAYLYRKITTLTGLTISPNDVITIKVESKVSNTLWTLYLNCLNDFDCIDCTNNNSIRKIIGTTIASTPQPCGALDVIFTITGCTETVRVNSDFNTYYAFDGRFNSIDGNSLRYQPTNNTFSTRLNNGTRYCQGQNCNSTTSICTIDSTPTIYDKTFLTDGTGRGVFGITGSSTVISTYYSGWVGTISSCWTNPPPTQIEYYMSVIMRIPSITAPDNCGDTQGIIRSIGIYLHPTSTVFTGTTISGGITLYYIHITANTITNQVSPPFDICDRDCTSGIISRVNLFNNYSTGSTTNYGTNKSFSNGIYYQNPIYADRILLFPTSSNPSNFRENYFQGSTNIGNTYPFSGTPANDPLPSSYTIIPSLSGTVCNYNQSGRILNYGTFQTFRYELWRYRAALPNPLSNTDFEIWATPVINYVLTPPEVLVYQLSGGTVTTYNTAYII